MVRKKGQTDGLVYSTGPSPINWDKAAEQAGQPTGPAVAALRIEKKGRRGKAVTVIELRNVTEARSKEIGKLLKQQLGVGGTTKGAVIEIQGDQREAVREKLREEGMQVKG